jgi:hypothetical protein
LTFLHRIASGLIECMCVGRMAFSASLILGGERSHREKDQHEAPQHAYCKVASSCFTFGMMLAYCV